MTHTGGTIAKGARFLIGDGRGGWGEIGVAPFPKTDPATIGIDLSTTGDLCFTTHYGADGPEIVDAAYARQPFAAAEQAIRNALVRSRETIDAANILTGQIANYTGLLGAPARDLPEGTMTRQRRRAEARAARKGRRVP